MAEEFDPQLRRDILDPELIKDQKKVKFEVQTQYKKIIEGTIGRSQTSMPTKNIIEVQTLIKDAFENYYEREGKGEDAQVRFSYEKPDTKLELEIVSLSLERREPGSFSQGGPFAGGVKNLKPILREEKDDPDNPGYKLAILGYWYDNTLRMTCWARTNKAASDRALWVENVMVEYNYYFTSSGVPRVIYQGRGPEVTREFDGVKVYGRSIDYYVKTERLRAVRQKTLELIIVQMAAVNTLIS